MAVDVRNRSILEQLPVELVSVIASHLSLYDFKHFRLSCRQISLATRHLLAARDFNGLPWRQDASRLSELSRIPECARVIRSITFNFARINEYKALHESFSYYYVLEPELRTDVLQGKWEQYSQTQRQTKAMGDFRLDLLKDALPRLPALEAVTLTWTRCPWEEDCEASRVFDEDHSIEMATEDEIRNTQHAVLSELAAAHVTLSALSLEPLRRWENPGTDQGEPATVYKGLRRLDLVLDRGMGGHLQHELTTLLQHTKLESLTELRLELLPWHRVHPEPESLPSLLIPHLEVLDLIRLEIGLSCLARFLRRHAKTLKKLALIGIRGVRQPSPEDDESIGSSHPEAASSEGSGGGQDVTTWEEVFERIRDSCTSLNEVFLSDTFTDPISGGQVWFHHDRKRAEILDKMSTRFKMVPAKSMERYLLGEGDMPPNLEFRALEPSDE
ncbi:hypothetical protein EsDP_00001160 [Epichloe bromicola]|uniref:F-box domain-containing protein n=1 Tax=Epichloe bromicola TaxID=79588 RepID=A0ABQ0CH18_9HYPO